jgi:hypothetical protein
MLLAGGTDLGINRIAKMAESPFRGAAFPVWHPATTVDSPLHRSVLITANSRLDDRVFPDPAMTLAAVDRIVHPATIFEMNVEAIDAEQHLRKSANGADGLRLRQ